MFFEDTQDPARIKKLTKKRDKIKAEIEEQVSRHDQTSEFK